MPGGGGSSEPQTVTQTTNTDPWSGQQPYLKFLFEEAQNQYQGGTPQYFPGSTVVPFSPETEQALGMQSQRATQGSPVMGAAQDQYLSTLQGDYLNANPYLNAAIGSAIRPMTETYQDVIAPGIDSAFAGAGRYGSNAFSSMRGQAADDLLRNVGEVGSNMSFGNYQAERGRQTAAMAGAPEFAQADYADIGRLADVGRAREALQQEQLADEIQRFNFEQNLPAAKLGQFGNLISGSYGGESTSTQTSPYYRGSSAIPAAGLGLSAIGTAGGLFGPLGPFGGGK